MRLFSLSILLVFIFSCTQKQEEKKASLLGDFWKKEIARLNKEKPMITKISTVNGKTDTLRTDSINWENELQIFVKSDLYEKDLALYFVDSTIVVDTLWVEREEGLVPETKPRKVIVFTAKNEDQKVMKIAFSFYEPLTSIEKIETVFLSIKDVQQLYGVNKRIFYNVNSHYTIEGFQDVKFLDKIYYKVEVYY
jgi:hypothetical protein